MRQKNIYIYVCVFQVSALKKVGMVGRHNILFVKIFYIQIAFFNTFFPNFPQIWQQFAHDSYKMFRVGAKT